MWIVGLSAQILNVILNIYFFVLIARLVFEWIPMFNRQWRPRGGWVVFAEVIYTLTDPPIKFIRKIVPPIRVGNASIDLAFTITMLIVFVLLNITAVISRIY